MNFNIIEAAITNKQVCKGLLRKLNVSLPMNFTIVKAAIANKQVCKGLLWKLIVRIRLSLITYKKEGLKIINHLQKKFTGCL